MFIPFPFPHAQLSSFYILVAIPAVAFLMDQYTVEAWVGAVLTFFTITALSGIHEVARELENPFRNVPNEIPLVTLQAQFNEALVTMYAGYHPDHFWREAAKEYKDAPPPSSPTPSPEFNTPIVKPSFSDGGTTLKPAADREESTPLTPIRDNVSSPAAAAPPQPSPSLEAQIQLLVQKIEDQGAELERLRQRSDEVEVVFENEKKME
uniref:Uncharacterized protein n=1 Tax=Entomoneis paludosa TaxID=265537 RepID=A0A7S2Y338_9STRA